MPPRRIEKKRRRGQRDLSSPMREWRFEVGVDSHGTRLDTFLSARLDWRSRTGIKAIINSGDVKILPGKDPQKAQIGKMKVGLKLRVGQEVIVELKAPGSEELEIIGEDPNNLEIIYEDANILAINKPPGLNVHPTHGHLLDSVIHRVHIRHNALYGKTKDMPTLCHRLDRETTGLVVLAKDQLSRTRLGRQFENRKVKKVYRALVDGVVEGENGEIDLPIARDYKAKVRLRMRVEDEGLASFTRWEVAQRYENMTLLTLYPRTGRQHQLRVHLASIGHPIIGDKLYLGGDDVFLRHLSGELTDIDAATLKLDHQALHSWKLIFDHPFSGETLTLEAPLWPTIAAYL